MKKQKKMEKMVLLLFFDFDCNSVLYMSEKLSTNKGYKMVAFDGFVYLE